MHKEHSGWWAKYNWVGFSFLSCCFSFHDQSFWIDECCTASCAVQPSLEECWRQICRIGGSDAQIAFYYYLLFLWHQVTGAESELALRLFNGVWVFLAGWFFRKEPKALVILLLSPFFIYYTEELRPYILQIAASCGVTMLLYQASRGHPPRFHALFGALFFLCLTSLTGVVWGFGFIVAFFILSFRQFRGRSFWKAVFCWIFPFAGLAAYYAYTLSLGARSVVISSSWVVNVAASLYELMGLAGLGPPHAELRLCTTLDSLWKMEGLVLGGVVALVMGGALVYGVVLWSRQSSRSLPWALLALVLIPGMVFLYGTEAMDFRFSGRHCAPLLPVLCLIWSKVWPQNWKSSDRCRVVLFILMMIVWLASDFRLRFCSIYSRENYREAVFYCKSLEEKGMKVLLLCNEFGGKFYGWHFQPPANYWSDYDAIVVSRPGRYAPVLKAMEDSGLYQRSALCQGFTVYFNGKVLPPARKD